MSSCVLAACWNCPSCEHLPSEGTYISTALLPYCSAVRPHWHITLIRTRCLWYAITLYYLVWWLQRSAQTERSPWFKSSEAISMQTSTWIAFTGVPVCTCKCMCVCVCVWGVFVTSDYWLAWLCVPQRSDNMSAHIHQMETRSYRSVVRPTHQTLPLITSCRLFGCQHTCDTLKFRYKHESHHVCRGERIIRILSPLRYEIWTESRIGIGRNMKLLKWGSGKTE